jgi:hypothetical protein
MFMARVVCAAALLVGVNIPAVASNLVRNGSFENPVVPDGQLQRFATGDKFKGWTVIGASGTVDIITGGFSFQNQTFPAKKGNQWLDLTGNTNTATGVQQTIDTSPGATYQISFFIGSAYDTAGQLGTSSTVHVLVDGAELAVLTTKGKAGVNQQWRKVSVQFVAQEKNTAIAFINGDPVTDTDCGIDVVSVMLAAAP